MSLQKNIEKGREQGAQADPYRENPLLIKTLTIDDCGVSDEVFEQLLLGLDAQNHIGAIHYINHNVLGTKSAKVLLRICERN